MENQLIILNILLTCFLLFKDMSGKNELRRIREELEKMNERSDERR